MNTDDWNKLEELLKKHKPSCGSGFLLLLFILFLNGCFKGCGY